MVIEGTLLVTKPIFRLFIVITPCQIHLKDIKKRKNEKKVINFYLIFGVILTYLKGIFSDYKYLKLGIRTDFLVQSCSGYFLDNYKQIQHFLTGYIWSRSVVFVNNTPIGKEELCYLAVFIMFFKVFYTRNNSSTFDMIFPDVLDK